MSASDAAGISTVGVLGCGLMGSGIAQVSILAGYRTVVRDISEEAVQNGVTGIEKRLARLVEKGELSEEDQAQARSLLEPTVDLAPFASCDIVIEAVVEDLAVKNALWKELEALCSPSTIFASNTSSLTIADMAAGLDRPGRMAGLHFFNPVPLMKLVEVVRTIATDQAVVDRCIAFARSLDKEPIECRDSSGFVVNLLLVPYMMDAIRALEQGVGSIEDIDTGMRLGTGHPMGPFTLCDFVGLDTLGRIGEIMFEEYREKRYAPPPLLKRMVSLGYFGRKSGRGFYDYSQDPPQPLHIH